MGVTRVVVSCMVVGAVIVRVIVPRVVVFLGMLVFMLVFVLFGVLVFLGVFRLGGRVRGGGGRLVSCWLVGRLFVFTVRLVRCVRLGMLVVVIVLGRRSRGGRGRLHPTAWHVPE